MKKALLLSVILLPLLVIGQTVSIGDILCTDESIVSRQDYPNSGKTAWGIVFHVDASDSHGWAVALHDQASSIQWCSEYYYGYDIPNLPNYENARTAMHDLDGYLNTDIIRNEDFAIGFPAAWAVDYDNGWYLPSAGQLRYLYSNAPEVSASLQVVGGTAIPYRSNKYYWSSTEFTAFHAYDMNTGGSLGDYVKDNHVNYPSYGIAVRQIRDFDIPNPTHPIYHVGDLITNDDGSQGILFYVSPDQTDGWMVALNDVSPYALWGSNGNVPGLVDQTCSKPYGALLDETDGYDNTGSIRSYETSPSIAAALVDYGHGWYLPTAGQLSKLFGALAFIEAKLQAYGSTLAEDNYWSSSEANANEAFALSCAPSASVRAGHFIRINKSNYCRVRAVKNLNLLEPPPPVPTLPDNIIEDGCIVPLEGFEWGIREDWSSGTGIYCRINPLVGDLDDDGVPEIVCFDMMGESSYLTCAKTINVYDGRTKVLKAQIPLAEYVWAHGNGPYGLVKLPNRKGLIVTAGYDTRLYAYDITSVNPSNPVWVSNESYNTGDLDYSVSIGFADFNGDGHPEIYVRNKIFDAETGVLLAIAEGGNNQADSFSHGSHTNHNKLSCPIAFDICGNTRQELILGNEIYDVVITNRDGTSGNHVTLLKTITPPNDIINDGHVQIADFNLDGHPDILVSNRDTDGSSGEVAFYVWDVYNERASVPIQLTTSFIGKSIPLIADFDNDGYIEILIDCCHDQNGLLAYRFNPGTNSFNFLWSLPIDEDSYSNTATLFDFNNDGRNELVFTDNSNLLVFDLSTNPPTELSRIDCGEITIMQVPIVADVDNDGSAEIVVTGKTGGYMQANTMLKVFKSSTEPWRASRKVWNQYMYHVTNVNEDLTIPTYCFNTATVFTAPDGTIRRPYNNFLQQAGYITPTGEPYNPGGSVEAEHYGEGCETYAFHGVTYTESGDYEYLIENPLGCDTLLTVHVQIGDTIHTMQHQSVCTPYTWNEITYNASGVYEQSFTSAQGCDSIVTLYLNVGEQIMTNFAVSTCDSFSWNGIEYTESGLYEQTFTSTQGCDSIVTLYLNVDEQIMTNFAVSTCDSYSWNGTTYTESGLYQQTFTTVHGCDSVVLLNLTIKASSPVSQIHGESLIYYQTNGQFTYYIDPVDGCFGYDWTIEGPWNVTSSPDSPECTVNINSPGTATLKVRVYTECGFIERTLFINHDARPDIVIYPNPTQGEFNIVLYGMQGEAVIVIYDYLGQFIGRYTVDTDLQGTLSPYSLAGKAAGVYLVTVINHYNIVTKKVVKETASSYGIFDWNW